jgi:hypothetical protein
VKRYRFAAGLERAPPLFFVHQRPRLHEAGLPATYGSGLTRWVSQGKIFPASANAKSSEINLAKANSPLLCGAGPFAFACYRRMQWLSLQS